MCVFGTHWNCLVMAIPISTNKLNFYCDISKTILVIVSKYAGLSDLLKQRLKGTEQNKCHLSMVLEDVFSLQHEISRQDKFKFFLRLVIQSIIYFGAH